MPKKTKDECGAQCGPGDDPKGKPFTCHRDFDHTGPHSPEAD